MLASALTHNTKIHGGLTGTFLYIRILPLEVLLLGDPAGSPLAEVEAGAYEVNRELGGPPEKKGWGKGPQLSKDLKTEHKNAVLHGGSSPRIFQAEMEMREQTWSWRSHAEPSGP